MSSGTTIGLKCCGQPECWHGAEPDWQIEQLRIAALANYLRRERQVAVFKALGVIGLTILICASALTVAYALGW
jgi:hypothetical protein